MHPFLASFESSILKSNYFRIDYKIAPSSHDDLQAIVLTYLVTSRKGPREEIDLGLVVRRSDSAIHAP